MSWTDEELDKLFREASGNVPTPEFKPEFFADIEKQLPVKKERKPFAWWWTANLFLVAFLGWTAVELFKVIIPVGNESLAKGSKREKANQHVELKKTDKAESQKDSDKVFNIEETENNKIENINTKIGPDLTKTSYSDNNALKSNANTDLSENMVDETSLHYTNLKSEKESDERTPETAQRSSENEIVESDQIGKLDLNDLISTHPNAELEESVKFAAASTNRLYYAELELGLQQAWTRSDINPSSVSGVIGLNGGVILAKSRFRYSVGIGLSFMKFDDLKIKERSVIYGFGSNILENTYSFNSMLSATVPLKVEFISGRHGVEGSLIPSINLLTGVHRYQNVDGDEIISRSGYSGVSLFNRFGLKPTIGYSYFVKENTQLGVRAGLQLLQPIQSDRFIGSPVSNPFEGQFYIRQTISLRK